MIFGDFNAVLSSGERWGRNGFDSPSDELVDFVELLGLQDLPLIGSSFIFFAYGQSRAKNRLDRFLLSSGAGEWCHSAVQKVEFCLWFDHIPVTLSSGELSGGPRPFKIFNIWCKDLILQGLVSSSWLQLDSSSLSLWQMFSQLRAKVKNWQSDNYSSMRCRSRECDWLTCSGNRCLLQMLTSILTSRERGCLPWISSIFGLLRSSVGIRSPESDG